MSENLRMLSLLFDKLSKDREYFAYYFQCYIALERKDMANLVEELNIDVSVFYRLALCKAPTQDDVSFARRLQNVSSFSQVDISLLLKIIRLVNNAELFMQENNAITATLMAAREKNTTLDDETSKL